MPGQKKVWVYLKTGDLYPDPVNEQQLKNKRLNSDGTVKDGQLQKSNGVYVDVELISEKLRKQRGDKVWVYLGTATTTTSTY